MTDKQPEALRLADEIGRYRSPHCGEAAAELRRLYELNEDLYQQGIGFIARIAELEQAGRQALEALEADNSKLWPREKRSAAITALREQLEGKK